MHWQPCSKTTPPTSPHFEVSPFSPYFLLHLNGQMQPPLATIYFGGHELHLTQPAQLIVRKPCSYCPKHLEGLGLQKAREHVSAVTAHYLVILSPFESRGVTYSVVPLKAIIGFHQSPNSFGILILSQSRNCSDFLISFVNPFISYVKMKITTP